jgi:hypothetical protein
MGKPPDGNPKNREIEGNMKKAIMICPFTGECCMECSLYRGRHQNLCFHQHFQNINDQKDIQKDQRWENGRVVKTPYPVGSISKQMEYADKCC